MSTVVRPFGPGRVSSVENASALQLVLRFDDNDTPADAVDALLLKEFVSGAQPWARSTRLGRVRADASLLPAEARLLRLAKWDGGVAKLAAGDGWTLRVVVWPDADADITVTAVSEHLADAVLAEAVKDAAEPPAPDDSVLMGFWYRSPSRGVLRITRKITGGGWAEIRGNYASAAAAVLDELMAQRPETINGRLVLLHGPPGTGKTTALRALAREWREWCQVDCVLDPDRLFNDPSYLMDVAVSDDGGAGRGWRLLILEDCDELIRGEAKAAAGQALSRLLNLTDGLLGQGRRVLVAITTNEDLARLHPAIVRPGRCLAKIEIGALPYPEAVAWFGDSAGIGHGGATLAELYALRSGAARLDRTEAADAPGAYL